VSPQLISSFLELAFGRSDLISAELLLDRGFEMADTDTLNSGGGWCVRVKPKLELEDWWHSGYEEPRWRLVKAADDKASTFKRLGGTWPAAPNGKFYACLENRSKTEPIGLAQDGIWINAGVNYEFSGLLCDGTMFSNVPTSAKPVPVQISLYPENQLDGKPLSSVTINVDATTCRKFTATLPAAVTTGRATLVLQVPAGRKLVCDMLSLLPANHVGGIRKEVIDGMRQVPAAVIRFPGGCFASTYHWRNGIGDRDCRPVDTAHWWNFPMLNDLGTVEFLTMCKAIGSEPMLCVPVMFDDADNAADWVAFCNTGKHPLHRKAGIERAPMKVTYWELDNETYRRMDAITYAHRCVEFSRAMKQVDPSIKIIMNCYWIYHGKLREMLEIAGADIDIVNNRGGNIAELRGDLAVLAEYNAVHNRRITLCHSEYRANSYDLPTEPQAADATEAGLNIPKQKDEKDSNIAKASRWSYGLSVLCDFLEYQNFGGGFQFANFTGYNDGWGESMINCAKSKVYPSPTGQAFNFLRNQQMAWPLVAETDNASPLLRTQAAWDLKKQTLVLFALNLSSQPQTITFDISELNGKFGGTATVESLSAPVANAVVKEDAPSPITGETTEIKHNGKTITVKLKPYSATAVRLK
jgi:alpha-N-arabinofuranosidase